MRQFELTIELVDEIVLSARAASVGGHESLDYIPGATLLGAVASRLYPGLVDEKAWDKAWEIFHSGRIQFGNGLPLAPSGKVAWPMPLCWHTAKGADYKHEGQLVENGIYNFQHQKTEEWVQPRQLRNGYVSEHGELVEPESELRMKTAIDPNTGRAAQAQLFGYKSLQPGASYRAMISTDSDNKELLETVRQAVSGGLRLGRSRSAQYGRVRTTVGKIEEIVPVKAEGKSLTLWLLSDLAVRDTVSGAPVLAPKPQDLGLPRGKLDLASSFIRTRRYSPYNGKRQCYDLERQVISQGSVLAFNLDDELNEDILRKLAVGLGEWRETGLGKVVVNPGLLSAGKVSFISLPTAPNNSASVTGKPDNNPLANWLERKASGGLAESKAQEWAEKKFKELRQRYATGRRLLGLAEGTPFGPSASQWARVMEAARDAKNKEALSAALFVPDGASREAIKRSCAICKPDDGAWDVATAAAKSESFLTWLKALIEGDAADMPRRLHFLARLAQSMARQGEL